jgi:hypothetical protein
MHNSWRQPLFRSASRVIRLFASIILVPFAYGAVLNVPAGSDFQQALTNAQPGDTIVLTAGATYIGQFTLPLKSGDSWITIQSSQVASLPPGQRVTPLHSQFMPKLMCSECPVLQTAPKAHHYRFVGIEFTPPLGGYAYDLITLGSASATTTDQQAHDIEFDRVYVHGDSLSGSKRGIALQSASTTIKNSYFSDFKSDSQDAQAICGWNGPGPYRIENNYLEASGENIMFGGAAPSIQGLVPSDIVVVNNHFSKPSEWVGIWRLKNLLELKNAQRVTIWGNVFDNNFVGAQNGFAILFTVRTCEGGDYPWSVVNDVTFTYNRLTNIAGGIIILGHDNLRTDCGGGIAGNTRNITIANNLFASTQIVFFLLDGAANIFIDHNTALPTQAVLVAAPAPSERVMFTNNVIAYGASGIVGDSTTSGSSTIGRYFLNSLVRRNVFFGAPTTGAPYYPYDNFLQSTSEQVGFQDLLGGDYRLSSTSPYKLKGLDKKDLGADIDGLNAAIAGVVDGNPQSAEKCFLSVAPTAEPMGPNGGPARVAVVAAAACPWTVASNADWITVTPELAGAGRGAGEYVVGANNGEQQRVGALTVAGKSLSVVQERAGCVFSVSPVAQTFRGSQYSGNSFTVTTQPECNWTARGDKEWIGVYDGELRTGAGSVYIELGANDGCARTGSVTANGSVYSITQEGSSCAFSISPTAQAVTAAGGPGVIGVTCIAGWSWAATTNVKWITINSGSSGTGSGAVAYTVETNNGGPSRTGTIGVGGQSLTVTQMGKESKPPNPNKPPKP